MNGRGRACNPAPRPGGGEAPPGGLAWGAGLVLLALTPSLAGCPAAAPRSAGPSTSPPTRTAVVQFLQEPDSLNPYLSPMGATSALAALFYSGLVIPDDRGAWRPDLAEAVPTLANGGVRREGAGMRVTYRLRPGVTWHDGKPLTAEDVRASWALVMDPRFPAISRAGYDQIKAIDAPDPRTVVVRFKRPYAPYLELFPYVLPKHVLGDRRDATRQPWNRAPIGSGPFVLERWLSGDRLTARANPRYFRGAPAVPRIEARFVSNEATAYQLWRLGELDLLQGAPPTSHDALQREAPGRVYVTPTGTWEHLVFNLERPAVADVRVRRAIAHLIDRQQLNARAYGGMLQPAWSELLPGHWAFEPRVENRWPPDPVAARRLLDEAGWLPGPDGVRLKGGRRLTLSLVTTSDRPARALAAQLWRRQWRDAGIELEIDKQPASVVFGGTGGRLAAGAFDLALIASVSRPDPDSSFRWRSDQIPPAGQNRARYKRAQVDRLLDEGLRTIEQAGRKRVYHDLAAQLSLDLPVVPLLYWVGIDATSARLRGFRPNPTIRGNLWNAWEWHLEP